jgi:hypothetical protein
MSWDFDDLVKGQVTQTILQSVLERVGYRVRRFGVEELLPDLRGSENVSIRSSLPERIRFLPDFLVLDPELGQVHLTEVKFRRRLSPVSLQSLLSEIALRCQYWPETETVLMVAEGAQDRGYHQDHIRVIRPTVDGDLKAAQVSPEEWWEQLPPLQNVYRRLFGSFDNQQIADSVTRPLRDLARIERPKTSAELQRQNRNSKLDR